MENEIKHILFVSQNYVSQTHRRTTLFFWAIMCIWSPCLPLAYYFVPESKLHELGVGGLVASLITMIVVCPLLVHYFVWPVMQRPIVAGRFVGVSENGLFARFVSNYYIPFDQTHPINLGQDDKNKYWIIGIAKGKCDIKIPIAAFPTLDQFFMDHVPKAFYDLNQSKLNTSRTR